MYHNGSQADDLDNSAVQRDLFPPAPVATNRPQTDISQMQNEVDMQMAMGPMAANNAPPSINCEYIKIIPFDFLIIAK